MDKYLVVSKKKLTFAANLKKICTMNYIKRDIYLNKLIARRNNSEVKVITGPRRSGKSWLLSHVYYDYLLEQGVPADHIIALSFDQDDENMRDDLLDVKALKAYLYERIVDGGNYYLMLDEIQDVDGFERLVNGLNAKPNGRVCHRKQQPFTQFRHQHYL